MKEPMLRFKSVKYGYDEWEDSEEMAVPERRIDRIEQGWPGVCVIFLSEPNEKFFTRGTVEELCKS